MRLLLRCRISNHCKSIFQNGLVPVFVDSVIGTYNPTADMIIEGYLDKTKAIFLAHTLGNPLEIEKIKDFCEDKKLWLIEDNCDTLRFKIQQETNQVETSEIYLP